MELIQLYQDAAKTAIDKFYDSVYRIAPTDEDFSHVCNIAASIMMTRDSVLMGGSFAQAVVDNDLDGAINRADITCRQHLDFFVHCKKYVFPKKY
jgi:hypothetical protein